jgi:excisionase family DNA binding protein
MEVYTRKTAAEKMLVSLRTVDKLIKSKALVVGRLGKVVRISSEAIERCLTRNCSTSVSKTMKKAA